MTVALAFWDRLTSLGLSSARDFFDLPGVVVSGHVGRNVSRVELGDGTAYLKREHRVRWRDRLRSWQDGFGGVSLSAREAGVLQRLHTAGVPVPRPLAWGEADGQAFLLLEPAAGTLDLRDLPGLSEALAERIGEAIAGVHAAGVDQPDLFAKHFLIGPGPTEFTILDWQRARLVREVAWPRRMLALATFRATLGDHRLTDQVWDRLLAAYLRTSGGGRSLGQLHAEIDERTETLARRPAIRRQQVHGPAQDLVRIGGETVCAIPAVAGSLADPATVGVLYDPASDGRDYLGGLLRVRRYPVPFARWWAALRGKGWRSPELRAARLLFHLERHAIPAPKLLAYGQTTSPVRPAGSFLLSAPVPARLPEHTDREAVRQLLGRLHDAGCSLRSIGREGLPFGIVGLSGVVTNVHGLRLNRRVTRRQVRRDVIRVERYLRARR